MKGLTLIELMISVALLSIIFSVGVPGFGALIERHQSNTAISSLKRIFKQSRTIAIESELSTTTCPLQNNRCINKWDAPITIFFDSNNNQTLDANDRVFYASQMNISTGYWQKKRIDSPYMKFNSLGHAFSTATTFLYCPYSARTNHAKQLIINFQGRIRIKDYLSKSGTPYSNVAPLACNP